MNLFISRARPRPFSTPDTLGISLKTHQHASRFPATKPSKKEKVRDDLRKPLSLLLADTDGATTATGSLGVLTTDTETPVVTETTVRADLLEALEILTVLAVETVGKDLVVLAVHDIALSVQEPGGDLVLGGVLEDGDNALEFFGGKFTGTMRSSLDGLFSIIGWVCGCLR